MLESFKRTKGSRRTICQQNTRKRLFLIHAGNKCQLSTSIVTATRLVKLGLAVKIRKHWKVQAELNVLVHYVTSVDQLILPPVSSSELQTLSYKSGVSQRRWNTESSHTSLGWATEQGQFLHRCYFWVVGWLGKILFLCPFLLIFLHMSIYGFPNTPDAPSHKENMLKPQILFMCY